MTCSKPNARRKFGFKPAVLCAVALPALLALAPASAKTSASPSFGNLIDFDLTESQIDALPRIDK